MVGPEEYLVKFIERDIHYKGLVQCHFVGIQTIISYFDGGEGAWLLSQPADRRCSKKFSLR